MARPLRIEFAGATYHVMARGNQGQKICMDDHDREMWLATLVQAWKRTGWLLHAWALMGNHYHLLLETPEPNLVGGMKWLQGTYTQRYNARHRKRGHLFQGRYRAVPVDDEAGLYLQTVSTYIPGGILARRCHAGDERQVESMRHMNYDDYNCQLSDRPFHIPRNAYNAARHTAEAAVIRNGSRFDP